MSRSRGKLSYTLAIMTIFIRFFFLFSILYGNLSFCQIERDFVRLGVNEGLSQNSVREIFQDRQGFIWIGTGDGLNRYDGQRIKKYRESIRDKSPKRLPGKIISGKIVQDDSQNLWMIVDGQVVKMNLPTETFSIIRKVGGYLDCKILAICNNELFVATHKAVIAINIHELSYKTFPLEKAFGVYKSTNDTDILFHKGNNIYSYHIKKDATSLIVSTDNAGFLSPVMYDSTSFLFNSGDRLNDYDLSKNQIVATYPLPYDKETNKQLAPLATPKMPNGNIVARVVDKGFVVIDSAKNNFYKYRNIGGDLSSLSSNLIYTSFVDHSGNLWLGTEGGGISILNLKPKVFEAFLSQTVASGESSPLMVKSIYYAEPNVYIGTFSRGLFEVDRFSHNYRRLFDGQAYNADHFTGIFFIRKDTNGRIWMNLGSRVGTVDLSTGKFIKEINIDYTRKQISNNIPQCFEQIGNNKFMVGTSQSIYLIEMASDNLTITDLGLLDHRLEDDIQTIYKKQNGDVIIGKGEGKGYMTVRITKDNKPLVINEELQNLTIKCVYRDTLRKAFWYATNAGLVIQQDGQKEPWIIDEMNGLSNDFVYAILPEDDYSFWISTNKGLNKINLKRGDEIAVSNVEQYSVDHGLQSNEFNSGAYYKDDEIFFLGGLEGINWFDKRRFVNRTFTARSYITDVLVNEKSLPSDTSANFLRKIKLNYDQNNILIKFATLDYTSPEAHRYQYRLKEHDHEWINADNVPEARYSKLPHGAYEFEIRSANSEGVWSSPQQLLTLVLTPPFWLTTWFQALGLLSFVSIFFFLTRFYIKRKLEKQLRLTEKQLAVNRERLRISRDMHDELGTGLSKIALLSEVGKKRGRSDGKIINEISATSRGLTDKMGEIIWALNPQNDTLSNLSAYLKEYIYHTAESLPVNIVVDFPEEIPDINLGHLHRQQLMLVTKEALSNALKHAQATQISFTLVRTDSHILFCLADNGIGFDTGTSQPHKNGRGNGLGNMKSRMDTIGGYFSIRVQNGTEIRYGLNV